jgi:hypothetical protein
MSFLAPYLMSKLKISGKGNPIGIHAMYDAEVSRFLRKVLKGRSVIAEECLPESAPPDKEHVIFGVEAMDYMKFKIPLRWEDT